MSNAGTETERPLLVEFAELWSRGLADEEKLWQLFDVCEMYMYRPDYFGAPVFQNENVLMTPVFSTEDLLGEFVAASPALGVESGAEGFDWVRITGAQLFGLPIRARYLGIDLGLEHGVVLDLAARQDPPPLANNAPPFGINLEIGPDGNTLNAHLREDVS
ncbi:hypothetical protein G7068_04505 [Leucobacter viscericola]|uniref:Uncharacterized protein n=1 Tax=Leucobacter viscericola TaxID=2714935 RepID=A0A6G7XD67_9MICO|nr:hypothetical protein [Leucobacter viscericola]QIK62550.1 hypothetical protein G7068_04505 [Leucobacter viscericola]